MTAPAVLSDTRHTVAHHLTGLQRLAGRRHARVTTRQLDQLTVRRDLVVVMAKPLGSPREVHAVRHRSDALAGTQVSGDRSRAGRRGPDDDEEP